MTFAGWTEDAQGLHREFRFDDFSSAWAFMSQVAELAKSMNHHPDWSNSWNRVSITLISHDVGKVTERDTKMAKAIDGLLESRAGGAQ